MPPPPVDNLTLTYSSALDAPALVAVFDGNSSIAATVSNFPVNGFTAAFWINTQQATAGAVVLSYDDQAPGAQQRIWIKTPSNIEVGFGPNSTGGTGLSVADGNWHHVAITFAPSDATHFGVGVFVDGVLSWFAQAAISRTAGVLPENGQVLTLGSGLAAEPKLIAQVSEFELWNSVRTAAQIMTGMQARASGSDPGAVLVWSLTSAPAGTTVTGVTFAPSQPALQFRIQRALTASWTAVANTTYNLNITSSDNSFYAPVTGLAGPPYAISAFNINTGYSVAAQAVSGGQTGPWSAPAIAVTLELGQPSVTVNQPDATHLQAGWATVDQATSYQIALTKNGAAQPAQVQTGVTFDLTQMALGPDTWTYSVAAQSAGQNGGAALGPASPVPAMPAAPALLLTYTQDGNPPGVLQATLTTFDQTNPYSLVLTLQGQTAPAATPLLAPATSSYTFPGALTMGQVYNATARSAVLGALGPLSPNATVTIQDIIAPLITALGGDGTAHTITVTWQNSDPLVTNPSFVAELWNLPAGPAPVSSIFPATSPQVFTNPAVIDGASFQVRVRTVATSTNGRCYGRWSQFSPITIGGVSQVQNVTARGDGVGNFTVNWDALSGGGLSGVTYVVRIFGNSVDFSAPATSATSLVLNQSDTRVQCNQQYSITVAATATGHSSGPPSAPLSVTACVVGPFPPATPRVSDPLNASTGAFLYANVELLINAPMPLIFSVYYSGNTPTAQENPLYSNAPLGNRWNHSYHARLARDAANQFIYAIWGNLAIEQFAIPQSVTGNYPGTGANPGSVLALGANLQFTLTHADGMSYVFDNSGNLLNIFDRFGNRTDLAYSNAQLSTVTDVSSGRKLTFNYQSGLLHSVTDDANRIVVFAYTGSDLQSITDPRGHARLFGYTGASLIETVTDGRNNMAVKNIYTGVQVTKQLDARALASGQTYGTVFSYTVGTLNGVSVVVAAGTDRQNNAISFTTLQANGGLLASQTSLGAGIIKAEQWTLDGFNNVLTDTVYIGPSAGYTSGMGNTASFTYDGSGNQTSFLAPLGGGEVHYESSAYDSFGNIQFNAIYEGPAAGATPGVGNRWNYTYYADHTLHTITDPLNRVITVTYQPGAVHGLVATVTDETGNTSTFTYTGTDLHTVTNALGEGLRFDYDAIGRVKQQEVLAPDGTTVLSTTKFDYNENSQVKTVTQFYAGQTLAQAFVTQLDYDPNGNRILVTDATGVSVNTDYNPNNFVSLVTYPLFQQRQRLVKADYDRNDFLSKVTLTANPATTQVIAGVYVADAIGRFTQFTDPRQLVYQYSNQMAVTGSAPYATQSTKTWPVLASDPTNTYRDLTTYDAIGRIVSYQDRRQQVTSFRYSTQPGPGGTTQWVVTTTYPAAKTGDPQTTIVRVFDPLWRLVSVQDQAGKVTNYTYAIIAGQTPGSFSQTTTITEAAGYQRILTVDAAGRTISDSRGKGTTFRTFAHTFNALNWLASSSVTQGASTVTTQYSFGFDAPSKTLTVTIGRPGLSTGATVQSFDGLSRLVGQADPFGNAHQQTYTPWGALASFTNGRGQALTYNFDDAGRLAQIDVPNGAAIVHTIDADGNRTHTQQATVGIDRQFDEWNRLNKRTGAGGEAIQYTYWPTDQQHDVTYSDGKKVTYVIDNLQRLITVTDWKPRITTYNYGATNLISSVIYANGASSTLDRDDGGRLFQVTLQSAGLVVGKWSTTLDALGQPGATNAVLPLPPTLPASGPAYTYGTNNQLLTVNGAAAVFDNDGNYLGQSASTPSVAYDVFGRVVSASVGLQASYVYDADGLRVSSTVGGLARSFVYDVNAYQSAQVERGDPWRAVTGAAIGADAWGDYAGAPVYAGGDAAVPLAQSTERMLELRDASQAIQIRFIHGVGLIAQEDAAGQYRVFLADPSGNSWVLTDENGVVTDRLLYGPFGDDYGYIGASGTPFKFAGRYGVPDDGSGLLYMRARSFAPSQSRFVQPDFLLGDPKYPQTLNQYAFAAGNPIQNTDPLGLDTLGWVLLGVGSALFLGAAGLLAYAVWGGGAAAAGGAAAGAAAGEAARLLGELGDVELEEFASSEEGAAEEPARPAEVEEEAPVRPGPDYVRMDDLKWEWQGLRRRTPFSARGGNTESLSPNSTLSFKKNV